MKKTNAAVHLLSLSLIVTIGATSSRAQADDNDDKRGFRPGRFIGKLIPGGKDRGETSPTMAPPVSDGAVVIPNPQNPVVPPQAPTRPPVATASTGGATERIPPPPLPGTAGNPAPVARVNPAPVPAAPTPGTPTAANPFGEPMEKDRERGLLSGVAGVVGKVIPGGRDDESVATVVPASGMTEPEGQDERGILGRLRDRRGNRPPAAGDNLIPPPTIIPRPVENPAVLPPPDRPNSPETMADAPAQRLTIPLTRSGNPGAPVQREERDPDEVKPSQPASIDPTMPPSGTPESVPSETQAAVGRLAGAPASPGLSAPASPPASPAGAQTISEPITPSVPVSRLTSVPGDARPAIADSVESSVAVSSPAGQMPASSGAPASAETNRIPSPTLPPAATSPEPVPSASPERRSAGLVISDQGGLAVNRRETPVAQPPAVPAAPAPASSPPAPAAKPSAVAALTGQPAAPPEPELVAAPRPVPASPTTTAGTPAPEPPTGSTHFVSIRDGVDGSVRTADGRTVAVTAGTVMRWQGGDEKTVKVQLADGTVAVVETWQVRDATFDEAVEFLKKSG